MSEPLSLITITEATRMLAEARSLDDVRQLRDVAEAARVYARAHDLGLQAENHAAEIKLRAERRIAEMVRDARQAGELADAHRPKEVSDARTLPDFGLDRRRVNEWTEALSIPEPEFEAFVSQGRAGRLSSARVRRMARDSKAGQDRAQKAAVAVLPPSCDLRFGDFRDVLADIPDGSVDLILTDPPYPAEFLPLWDDLGRFARRVLKPTGMLAAMSGQVHLPAIYAMLGAHLDYRWTMAYLMDGQANVVHARRVSTMWKPILVYGSTERRLSDVARSGTGDKEHHEWGQSESGMADLIRILADPGALVCDPFVGGGTTALVALDHGCSFVGAEVDKDAHAVAVSRLAA